MKSLIKKLLLLIAVLLTGLNAQAYDFEVDGLYYNILSEDDRTVEVTYLKYDIEGNSNYVSGELTIPPTVVFKSKTYNVISIGKRAFQNCLSLKTVDIPNSVTTIGEKAFNDCRNLSSIEIPNSVTTIGEKAFKLCDSLKSVEIPNSVTTIGNMAFLNCGNLSSVEIPNSVTTLGKKRFPLAAI